MKSKSLSFKIFSVTMSLVLLVSQTQSLSARPIDLALPAIDVSVLELDESALDLAMEELNELDTFVSSNEGVTYSDLEASGNDLIINIENSTAPLGMAKDGEPPMGIPSFLWGCVFGIVGLLVVYILTDGDKEESKKAMWGCVVSGLVSGGLYVVVYSSAFALSTY